MCSKYSIFSWKTKKMGAFMLLWTRRTKNKQNPWKEWILGGDISFLKIKNTWVKVLGAIY